MCIAPVNKIIIIIQAASFHLQSGDGECLPATQLYLSVFTCPTVSLDLPLDAGESLPARQPYLSNLLLDEAYPSDTAILNHSRTSARASGTNSLTFSNLLLDEASPSDTAILKPQSDVGESLRDRQTFLFHPAAGKAYPTTLPVDCEAFRPPKLYPSV